ncbi:hypothetical protein EDC04DRAFT_1275286 [Pisolithus marmoratus]|nr:hypothetical protein EDC04DRAFT_1275286 [Pisolithus marmoratus]
MVDFLYIPIAGACVLLCGIWNFQLDCHCISLASIVDHPLNSACVVVHCTICRCAAYPATSPSVGVWHYLV